MLIQSIQVTCTCESCYDTFYVEIDDHTGDIYEQALKQNQLDFGHDSERSLCKLCAQPYLYSYE